MLPLVTKLDEKDMDEPVVEEVAAQREPAILTQTNTRRS